MELSFEILVVMEELMIEVKEIGQVCVYCGTETEYVCCGEVHRETGYETNEQNPELLLESELTDKHKIVEEL